MALILCSGFDKSLYPAIRLEGGLDHNTIIVTIGKGDLPLTLGELEKEIERSASLESNRGEPLDTKQRYVIFSGEKSSLNNVIKGVKKAYKPPAGSVIFAMLTKTARTWTLSKYLAELAEEHEEMRKYQGNVPMLHERQ